MKVAVLGDTHFGMRNDSQIFHDHYAKFYQEVFFPKVRELGITVVIQTGDLFDRRKFINFNSLFLAKGYFFDEFTKGDMALISYLGNHDVYYKNTLQVNSPELVLRDYIEDGDIQIISKPQELDLYGLKADIIPWICQDNERETKAFIANSKNQICFGHFEIAGFSMEKGSVCYDGMNRDDLKRYEMVISGHFHHRSTDGHIYYVGTPGEITWADWEDQRGFHIFDTQTRDLEFVPNPLTMFHKVIYDDTQETIVSIDNKDYSEYANRYVKIIVQNKNSAVLFDRFISNFYQANPADISVVEDFTEYSSLADLMSGGLDQGENTSVLLDRYVDGIEVGLDKDKMKATMRKIYNEAQALENK
jgi:DNA repair exonuclease SbcCD nuclease subunit